MERLNAREDLGTLMQQMRGYPPSRVAAVVWDWMKAQGFREGAHAPTDDEREALAQWLHVRFGHNQTLDWDEIPFLFKEAWRDIARDAPLRRSAQPEPSAAMAAIERAKAFLTDVTETSEMRNRNAYGALTSIGAQGEPSEAVRVVPEPARMHIAAEGRGVLCGAVSPTHITNGTRYADCAACLTAAGGAR